MLPICRRIDSPFTNSASCRASAALIGLESRWIVEKLRRQNPIIIVVIGWMHATNPFIAEQHTQDLAGAKITAAVEPIVDEAQLLAPIIKKSEIDLIERATVHAGGHRVAINMHYAQCPRCRPINNGDKCEQREEDSAARPTRRKWKPVPGVRQRRVFRRGSCPTNKEPRPKDQGSRFRTPGVLLLERGVTSRDTKQHPPS